ncbi:MAG TPA: DUF935 family protein [Terriglobia bacterium]|nr:DUF935 family protein [Terriglobia bacterium]
MAAKGHSSKNGHQLKGLAREMRALHADLKGLRQPGLQERIDSAVALADREMGIGERLQRLIPGSPAPQGVNPPVPPPGLPPLPGVQTLGISGTPIIGGFLEDLGEYNPELAGRNAIPIYEQMRRGDAQVKATLEACKLPVMSAEWAVVPADNRDSGLGIRDSGRKNSSSANPETRTPNPVSSNGAGRATAAKAREVASFVKENLFGGLEFRTSTGGWASQAWGDVVRNALLMLDFGCAAHEDVWRVDGGAIRLRKLAARLPITFYRWHTEADGETLLALEQYGYRGSRFVSVLLPADKCAVFTHQQEGANFWGMALLRAMYPHWYVKNRLYRIDAIACERNSLGIPVFKLPPGFSKEDQETAYSFVTQLAAHEAAGLVEPPGDGSTGLRIVGYEGRVRDVAPSIEHHNVMISRAALALFMDLGQAQHGSRALGQQSNDFFMLALQNVADQIAYVITNTTVRRLVAYNFGDDAPLPRLVAANVQARGLDDMVEALTKFAQAGLVVSEQNLRSFIRKELALPEESSSGVVAVRSETIAEGADAGDVVGKGAASGEQAHD